MGINKSERGGRGNRTLSHIIRAMIRLSDKFSVCEISSTMNHICGLLFALGRVRLELAEFRTQKVKLNESFQGLTMLSVRGPNDQYNCLLTNSILFRHVTWSFMGLLDNQVSPPLRR